MMRLGTLIGVAVGAMAMASSPLAAQPGRGVAPEGPLNTLADVRDAIPGCGKWPPLSEVRQCMELTTRLSFKRNGEIFGAGLTCEKRHVTHDERKLCCGALLQALKRGSPLPVSESRGGAIAGRPFMVRFKDTRRVRKA